MIKGEPLKKKKTGKGKKSKGKSKKKKIVKSESADPGMTEDLEDSGSGSESQEKSADDGEETLELLKEAVGEIKIDSSQGTMESDEVQ